MEILVNKEDFKKAIILSRKALSKVIIQEERGHLLFNVCGNKIHIQGTNNDLKARCIIDVDNISGKDFSFTSDPKILEKLVSKMDVDKIRMVFDPEVYTIKVYTSDNKRSYTTLQSFSSENMLTFKDPSSEERKTYSVNLNLLLFTVKYALNYLAAIKEDQKHFDFLTISKGIAFAANGSNKMGFVVANNYRPIPDIKIRKQVLPVLVNFLMKVKEKEINIVETGKDIGVESIDGNLYFSSLKTTIESPKINKDYLRSEEPYVEIDKNRLMKIADRVVVNSFSAAMIGLETTLSGSGNNSTLELKLVSKNEAVEIVNCSRKGDTDKDITNIIDYKLLRNILGSFKSEDKIRMHICDKTKFWKAYSTGEIDDQKFIVSCIGTYAKVVREN
jgi:hypothetical protein